MQKNNAIITILMVLLALAILLYFVLGRYVHRKATRAYELYREMGGDRRVRVVEDGAEPGRAQPQILRGVLRSPGNVELGTPTTPNGGQVLGPGQADSQTGGQQAANRTRNQTANQAAGAGAAGGTGNAARSANTNANAGRNGTAARPANGTANANGSQRTGNGNSNNNRNGNGNGNGNGNANANANGATASPRAPRAPRSRPAPGGANEGGIEPVEMPQVRLVGEGVVDNTN